MNHRSQKIAYPLGLLAWSLVVSTLGMAGGCSLGTVEQKACTSNDQCTEFGETSICADDGYCTTPTDGSCNATADCRRSVGFGSVCSDGRCENEAAIDRCAKHSYPEDLFSDPEAHRDRLVFGMLMDQTVAAHKQRENSAELAAIQINNQKGIEGREFGIIFCDVEGGEDNSYGDARERPDAAVFIAEWLVDVLELPAIIGPASSGDTTRVYTEVVKPADGRTIEITPSGTSPSLTALDHAKATDEKPGLLWRSAPSANQQGEIIAEHMGERTDFTIKNVAIIHEEAAFGEAVAGAFSKFWADGFSGTFRLFGYGPGNRVELMETIGTVGARLDEFEAVVVLAQVDEMGIFMRTATDDDAYPDDIPLYFGDTGANREIFQGVSSPRLFDNVLAATVDVPDTFVNRNYRDTFMARYDDVDPSESSFTANSYDAMWLLAFGAAWATYNGDGRMGADGHHEVDGRNIARGLRMTAEGVEIEFVKTAWPSGLSQLMSGSPINVVGASGNHDWDLDTEEAPGPTALLQTDSDGKQVIVKQIP